MSDSIQPLIVCATRGGQGSRVAQRAAIARARQDNARLRFLYVVDEDTLLGADEALRPAIRSELLWVGRALVQLAARRGRLEGVSAEVVVLEGHTRQQISAYLREHAADVLFIGAPRGTTTNHFGDDEIEQFTLEIERETQAAVVLVRPEQGVGELVSTEPSAEIVDE